MNVLILGATGMVGQGVLRECLLDPGVERVVTLGRRATGRSHEKLEEIVVPDLFDLSAVEAGLVGFGACFFCLGVSSAGMTEDRYSHLTHDLTLSIATTLARLDPEMTFIYVSGAATDSTERGRVMWARVKGRTENALRRLPFQASYMFRPGIIIPLHGVRSRTRWTRLAYSATKPLHGLLRRLFPAHVTTSEVLGRAMIAVARDGYERPILEMPDIERAGRR
jgi:uncharacterized protein YbjT (DUF2867 family)